MKALILAAGEAPTAGCPRPLLPVGDVPLLEQIVSLLRRHGIADIAIDLHYKPWAILQHLGHGRLWGVHIHYSFDEQLLGSAGAAKRLEWYLDESFIVYRGDVYTEMELSDLMKAHRRGGGLVTMGLCELDNPTKGRIVQLDGQSRVRCFMEKLDPDQALPRLANAGILVVEPEVLSGLPAEQYLDFGHDVIPQLMAAGQPVMGYPISDSVIEIGTPENHQKAQRLAAQRAAARAETDQSYKIAAPTVRNVFRRFAVACAD